MSPLRIVIIGAGIGGLAAAIGLARNGHNVTVYERSKSSGGVGYAFRITANSDRCLRYIGINTVAGGACASEGGQMLSSQGEVLVRIRENDDAKKAKSARSVFAYRPQLHQQLWEATLESGAQLISGVKVESVDAEKSTATLEGGEIISADLIIGSDGIKSAVRPQVVDTSKYFPKASSGDNCFRFMLSKEALAKDDLLSSLFNHDGNHIYSWRSKESLIVTYPVDFGKQVNIVCSHPEYLSDHETVTNGESSDIDYNQKVSAETAISIYKDFEPRAVRILELADPDGFRIWKLMDMEETPRWSHNNTVLLGDACHPVLPFSFSGASMAIEDGLTLSTLLPSDVKTGELKGRLELYEEIRKPRVGRVRAQGLFNSKHGNIDQKVTENYMAFINNHDAVEHAKQALADYQAGKRQSLNGQ